MRGPITKAGNAHVRRLLIESAWHHRAAYRDPGATIRARWAKVKNPLSKHAGMPVTNGDITSGADSPSARRTSLIANVAIARELAGWCWSLATMN